jgi:precorrin-6B methylase 2
MDVGFVLKSIRKQFCSHGITGVFQMLSDRVYIRYQEWKYGIQTEMVISRETLGLEDSEFLEYGASDWRHLRKVIKRLDLQYPCHVFVDFGAGMGRVLIVAAGFRFKRVIGVELSRDLARIAERNIRNAQPKLACSDIRVIQGNATEFVIEPDMSIFYFFNPFYGRTLDSILEAIYNSIAAHPRIARVICRLPPTSEFATQIQQVEWLSKQGELMLKTGTKYWVFESRLHKKHPL